MTDEQKIAAYVTELEKCDVRCRFHHQIRSSNESRIKNVNPDSTNRARRDRGRDFINVKKMERGKCARCELQTTPETLAGFDLDHIDESTKHFNVSSRKGSALETLDEEISKCQLLCANCHMEKTVSRKGELRSKRGRNMDEYEF